MSSKPQRTFKEQLELNISVGERSVAENPTYTKGRDRFHLSDEEEYVFNIDRKRFIRMINTWEAYEKFKGIAESGVQTEEGRRLYPQWAADSAFQQRSSWRLPRN